MDTYQIIYHDILRIPELEKSGALFDYDFTGSPDVSFVGDELDYIVNELDKSMREADNHLLDLRLKVLTSLTANSPEVKPSQVKLVYNAGEEERLLKWEFIDTIFPRLRKDSRLTEEVLKEENLSINSIEDILSRRLDMNGRRGKRRDSQYMREQRRSKMAGGFVQFIDYPSTSPIDLSCVKIGQKGRRVAIAGRAKSFPSAVEKVGRKVSEYISKCTFLLERDRAKLPPLEEYVLKNDLAGMKVIFPCPEIFYAQANQDIILHAAQSYARAKRHQFNTPVKAYAPKFKRDGLPISRQESSTALYDTIFIDIKAPTYKPVQAEIQVTDAINYAILENVSERSHKLRKERLKRGLPDEFFEQRTWKRAMDYENRHKKRSYVSFKEQVRSRARSVNNFLIDRYEIFLNALQEHYGTRESDLPPFMQYDRAHYCQRQRS